MEDFSNDLFSSFFDDPVLDEKSPLLDMELDSPMPGIQAEHSYSLSGDSAPQSPIVPIKMEDTTQGKKGWQGPGPQMQRNHPQPPFRGAAPCPFVLPQVEPRWALLKRAFCCLRSAMCKRRGAQTHRIRNAVGGSSLPGEADACLGLRTRLR